MHSVIILGRQPALGLAELESLYGAEKIRPVVNLAALVDVEYTKIDFKRLGGAVKLATVLTILDKTDWRSVEAYLLKTSAERAKALPKGKLHLGLSAYDFHVTPQQLTATGLSIKKTVRKTGRSVHLIPNNEPELSSAQVFHNKLTGEHGWELLLIRDNNQTIIAQTTDVQDIDGYTERDRGRPKRDARVGMLPPKLAQTIINLAVGHIDIPSTDDKKRILDPFCGTGVVLQEAILMGYNFYGSDLESRMIEYSRDNLIWLRQKYTLSGEGELELGDATSHQWQSPIDFVASETYLGKPFTSAPDPPTLAATIGDCNLIISKFLKNIHEQLKPGTRLCIAVPAWNLSPKNNEQKTINRSVLTTNPNSKFDQRSTINDQRFKFLPLVDSLEKMGYNRVRFEHVRNDQLLYYREDQIVARQLLVLTRQ